MADIDRRKLELLLAHEQRGPTRDEQAILKREGGSCGPHWSTPHVYLDNSARELMSYGNALALLRDEASEIHPFIDGLARPLTFKETWTALIRQYRANNNHFGSLWEFPHHTCTGIYHESGKLNVIPVATSLLSISPFFIDDFASTGGAVPAYTVNISDAAYNVPLSRQEVLDHAAWNAVFELDRTLLEEVVECVFDYVERMYEDLSRFFWGGPPRAMAFYIKDLPEGKLGTLRADDRQLSFNARAGRFTDTNFARLDPS